MIRDYKWYWNKYNESMKGNFMITYNVQLAVDYNRKKWFILKIPNHIRIIINCQNNRQCNKLKKVTIHEYRYTIFKQLYYHTFNKRIDWIMPAKKVIQ